jgi:protein phosphatase
MEKLEAIWSFYAETIKLGVSVYEEEPHRLVLPIIPLSLLRDILRNATRLFAREKTVIKLTHDLVIVGDIHGQILDLFRIINSFGFPGASKYLFMGDLVDRGEFSIEAVVCVFLLKAIWPDHVHLIRGNHEFAALCAESGFMAQVISFYGSPAVFQEAVRVFAVIPLAARVDERVLCVHGGIGPRVFSLNSIANIERPITDFGDDVIDSLVWSDPSPDVVEFEPSSTRGAGYLFGAAALDAFLESARLEMLVRAHECIQDGAHELFDGKCLTIFSASNYCGLIGNDAAVLEVLGLGKWSIRRFPPLAWLSRTGVAFAGGPDAREVGANARRVLTSPGSMMGARRPSAPISKIDARTSLEALPKLSCENLLAAMGSSPSIGIPVSSTVPSRIARPEQRTRPLRRASLLL